MKSTLLVITTVVIASSRCLLTATAFSDGTSITPRQAVKCSAASDYQSCTALGPSCSPCCNWNAGTNCSGTDMWIGCMDAETEQCCSGNEYSGSVCSKKSSCCEGWSWSDCCSASTVCWTDMHSYSGCFPQNCLPCDGEHPWEYGIWCTAGTTCNLTSSPQVCVWPNGTIAPPCN